MPKPASVKMMKTSKISLADLEKSRVTIEKEQAEINRYKQEIQSLKERLEQKQEKLDASRDKILRDANEEAFRILKEAKDVADETIRNFNKYGKANAPMSEMEKERTRLRDKMNASQKKLADQKKKCCSKPQSPEKTSDWRHCKSDQHEFKRNRAHTSERERRPLRPDGNFTLSCQYQ